MFSFGQYSLKLTKGNFSITQYFNVFKSTEKPLINYIWQHAVKTVFIELISQLSRVTHDNYTLSSITTAVALCAMPEMMVDVSVTKN